MTTWLEDVVAAWGDPGIAPPAPGELRPSGSLYAMSDLGGIDLWPSGGFRRRSSDGFWRRTWVWFQVDDAGRPTNHSITIDGPVGGGPGQYAVAAQSHHGSSARVPCGDTWMLPVPFEPLRTAPVSPAAAYLVVDNDPTDAEIRDVLSTAWACDAPFKAREPERESLLGLTDESSEEAIGVALGAVSACWEHPELAGAFDSRRAERVHQELVDHLRRFRLVSSTRVRA